MEKIIAVAIIELLFMGVSYFVAFCFIFDITFGNNDAKGLLIARIISTATIITNLIICYLCGNKLLKNINPHPILFEWVMVLLLITAMTIAGEITINSHPKLTATNLYTILYNFSYIISGIVGSYFAKTNKITHA